MKNVGLMVRIGRVMVPAYDDPVIWDGHSSMITEIHAQLPRKPDAIVCAVGGGGLLGGVLVGCANVGWDDGVASFHFLPDSALIHRQSP